LETAARCFCRKETSTVVNLCSSQVAFYDRDVNLRSARSSWMYSFLGLNGLGGTTDYVFASQFTEPNSYGYAGFYFCITTLVGNLILSNLVVNILGERYSKACQDLVKSKRKQRIENFVRHGRHVLLSKLYIGSTLPTSRWTKFRDKLPTFLRWPLPFFPWLANKFVGRFSVCMI
jgi:hypothetical protein